MFENIVEPTLIVHKKKCLSNISRMAQKAADNSLVFRPHFKTHQSQEVGEWFRDFGVTKITVSSVAMAKNFSEYGWKDITVAFPLNPREINRINSIDKATVLNLTVENKEALALSLLKLNRPVNIFIKIDTGYQRTGIPYNNTQEIQTLLTFISQKKLLTFKGFLIHAGQTYNCNSQNEVLKIHQDSLSKISFLKKSFIKSYPDLIVSYGDTPSCSIAEDFENIDEIRPGNFVFYDLMQQNIGSCSINDIAVTVACPVVAKHPSRHQIIVHGGAVHFSKEHLLKDGNKFFGLMWIPGQPFENPDMLSGRIIGLSQEHGIVEVTDPVMFNNIKIGNLLFFLPIHSCLTANLLEAFIMI